MKEHFINLLKCPNTNSDLKLTDPVYSSKNTIESGKLISSNEEYSYPIIKGIPRFSDK